MQNTADDQLWLINTRRAESNRQAALSRSRETPAPSIRRALGTSIVRFGARLAGDQNQTLARSR